MSDDDHGDAMATSVEALLAHSLEIEREAAERYADLADQMEMHNNHDVAALFRKLEAIEGKHVARVEALGEGRRLPHISPWDYAWHDAESPEGPAASEMHYLMTPHHALTVALAGEERAVAFFEGVVAIAESEAVKEMAGRMLEEEREHVVLMREWLQRYPAPASGWDEDPDPPAAHE